jgi:hypothetical protein
MKKNWLPLFSILLGAITSSAQQNVGIGTNSPAWPLHVVTPNQQIAGFDGGAGMYIGLYEQGVYRGYIGSYLGAAPDVDFGTGGGNTTGKLHLATQAVARMTIRENGFVGIGNTNPGYLMDVNGRIRLQAGTVNNVGTSAGTWHTDYRTNTDIAFIGMADSVNYGFWGSRPNVGWQFYFDARYGNVGIGQKPSSGSTRLVLDHPTGAGINLFSNGNYSGGFQATDSTLEIFSASSSSLCFPQPCNPPPAKDIVIWPEVPCTSFPCINLFNPGKVGFYTTNPTSRVHIVAGTGNSGVLIGGSASESATGYMLNVDGKIMCEELRVQISTAWPDYVFDAKYNLKNLDELESQVRKDGHLPGILPAAKIEADGGVEIGEMQRKMLEKIEELYLYVFELNKENKALKAEMAKTKKRR